MFLTFKLSLALLLAVSACRGEDLRAGLQAMERKDYATAFRILKPLAENGDPEAQCELSKLYLGGLGIRQDNVEGTKWLRLCAEHGNVQAQKLIGLSYEVGTGVPKDHVLAYVWLNIAAAVGEESEFGKSAAEERDRLAESMTLSEIAEAQARSREWKPRSRRPGLVWRDFGLGICLGLLASAASVAAYGRLRRRWKALPVAAQSER